MLKDAWHDHLQNWMHEYNSDMSAAQSAMSHSSSSPIRLKRNSFVKGQPAAQVKRKHNMIRQKSIKVDFRP